MACDPNTLLALAALFQNCADGEIDSLITFLLCQWANV